MSTFDDDTDVQGFGTSDDFPDARALEAVLSGRRVSGLEGCADAVAVLAAAARGPAPSPNAALALLLEEGFVPAARPLPSVGPPGRPRRWRQRGSVAVAGALAALLTAASANALPAPLQSAVSAAVRTVTPFTVPESAGPSDPGAGRSAVGGDGPGRAGDDARAPVEGGPPDTEPAGQAGPGAVVAPDAEAQREALDAPEDAADEREDAADEAADTAADVADDEADLREDAADDAADAQEDAADDEGDLREDAADDAADAQEDAAQDREDVRDDAADALEDAADEREDASQDAADDLVDE